MDIKAAYSTKEGVVEAVAEIHSQFGSLEPKLIVYFGSTTYDPHELAAAFSQTWSNVEQLGCTTAGEIGGDKMLKDSVVAMGFSGSAIADAKVVLVENLQEGTNVSGAFGQFEEYFDQPMADLDIHQYTGMIFIDGLSACEERLMDDIGNRTDLFFAGASAGDDLKFSVTHVFANGRAATNAAVLAVLRPALKFHHIKTQSFKQLPTTLVATKVVEKERRAIEFNGKPATEAYAEAVGTTPDKISDHFMSSPIGLMMDGEPWVRSPQRVDGSSIVFFCDIKKGMEYHLLESTDIVEATARDLAAKQKKFGRLRALINYHCILRTLELQRLEKTEAYGLLFRDIPTIGFSTYGEEYIGHINQTSTMLVLHD